MRQDKLRFIEGVFSHAQRRSQEQPGPTLTPIKTINLQYTETFPKRPDPGCHLG